MSNRLRRLWRRLRAPYLCKLKLRFHLASGQVLTVYCDEYHITFDNATGKLRSWKIEGAALGTSIFHVVPGEIVAIQRAG